MNETHRDAIQELMRFLDPLPAHAVITTHMQPDADAIGSACALKGMLRNLGVHARIINESVTPRNLCFLPDAQSIEVYDAPLHDEVIRAADVVFCCDLNDLRRTGRMAGILGEDASRTVMIDHHVDPQPFYAASFHDVMATSTAELMFRWIHESFPQVLDVAVATNIYAGVMSDTGGFRFPRVTSATHRMVAVLMDSGADPVTIYDRMNNTWSIGKTRLLGAVLSTMSLHCDGQVCTVAIPFSMIQETGCSLEDLDGMVHHTLSIEGVRCGVLIAERNREREIKLSFRSKGDFTVNAIAKGFGGGGHIYAAGARTTMGTLEEVRAEVIARVSRALDDVV
ncbi:MAG: DHH family phosphoesterase [Candidatus Kapaibacterium sp.]